MSDFGTGIEDGEVQVGHGPQAPIEDEAMARRLRAGGYDFWRKFVFDSLLLLISFFITIAFIGYMLVAPWAMWAGAIGTAVCLMLSLFGARRGAQIDRALRSGFGDDAKDGSPQKDRAS